MMDCEGGEVTIDNIEVLKLLEEELSYPPRFRLKFKANKSINSAISQSVTVKFNGVTPPAKAIVTLEKLGIFLFCTIHFCYYANYQIHRYQWSSLASISSFIS